MSTGGDVEAAIITASASVVVAVLGFLLNQWNQLAQERRQVRLARINAQLRELYGPLHALVDINERIWTSLHESRLPSRAERRKITELSEKDARDWHHWLSHALMPANRRMRELIIEHADLVIEPNLPQSLRDFCAHVTSYEVLLGDGEETNNRALISHPGKSYVSYVRDSYTRLKLEQQLLLAGRARIAEDPERHLRALDG